MKKLIIIPLFFFSLSVFGQFTKNQLYNGINLNIRNKGASQLRLANMLDSIVVSMGSGGGSMVYPGAGIPLSTGSAWDTSITDNSSNWNTAFGWGNHAGLYRPISYVPAWSEITSKPTTIAGYGITDFNSLGDARWLTDPMTNRGDVIIRNSSNVTARLGIGANTYVLTSDGTDIGWQSPGTVVYTSYRPEIISASIVGQSMEGKTLTLIKSFIDVDGTAEGSTTYQWVTASDASGTGKANIGGATSSTYTLTSSEATKYVACEITPVNASAETGDVYTTPYIGAVDAILYPADLANVIVSYGIKKMAVAYAGNCMQVQSSNGGTTTNIGFDANGDIDWAAVATHAASYGTPTYIKIWYDQSGNGFNMTFTAFTNQPLVNYTDKRIEWNTGDTGFATHNAAMNMSTGDFTFFIEQAQLATLDAQFTFFNKKTSYATNDLNLYSNIGAGYVLNTNAGALTSFYATSDQRNLTAGYRTSTTKYLRTGTSTKTAAQTAPDLNNTNNLIFNSGDGGDGQWYMWSFTMFKQDHGTQYDKVKKFLTP